jgi:hypothetical protein
MKFGKTLLFWLMVAFTATPILAQIGSPGVTSPPAAAAGFAGTFINDGTNIDFDFDLTSDIEFGDNVVLTATHPDFSSVLSFDTNDFGFTIKSTAVSDASYSRLLVGADSPRIFLESHNVVDSISSSIQANQGNITLNSTTVGGANVNQVVTSSATAGSLQTTTSASGGAFSTSFTMSASTTVAEVTIVAAGAENTIVTLSQKGVKDTTGGAKPACDSTVRGNRWLTEGGAGVADTYEVCTKDAGDAYAWRTLIP